MLSSSSRTNNLTSKNFITVYTRNFRRCFITAIWILFCINSTESSRVARAVMMSVSSPTSRSCSDLTITQKNATSTVILTGTVEKCGPLRAGTYKCTLKVWRIMKGRKLASGLTTERREGIPSFYYKKTSADVHGLGNQAYCESAAAVGDTRIFFLNRVNNRLVLSASVLRITLSNLQNTQAVIEGRRIVEKEKKPRDPCMDVLCGFGSHCETRNGSASCVCPDVSCGSGDGSEDLVAPVCGSDGVTYPNQCRLNAEQCLVQRRIKVVSENPCEPDCDGKDRNSEACRITSTPEPVVDRTLCRGVVCENSAVCIVRVSSAGSRTPSCVCPTCDDTPIDPVCGTDQRSHKSECEMRRIACIEGRQIDVIRRSACNPCELYNETLALFVQTCHGTCSINSAGLPVCCDDLDCAGSGSNRVCGSDGKTYQSQCALRSHACKTARNITVIKLGTCPKQKPMTTVTGSLSIEDDENCPGNCQPESNKFRRFISRMTRSVNQNLQALNDEDIDGRQLGEFQITEVRKGSAVLVYRALASTAYQPITAEEEPNQKNMWIYERLFDPEHGAVSRVVTTDRLTVSAGRRPYDDFVVEDVCLQLQCQHGAVCNLETSDGSLHPTCSCDSIPDENRLAVTYACKRASNGITVGHVYSNRNDARRAMCTSQSFLTFQDICIDTSPSPCESGNGCHGSGQVCIIKDGKATCECVTCGSEYQPVCSTDGQTFRSACEVERHNCLSGGNLSIQNIGPCESECNDVECWHGAQCEPVAQGTVCVCPTSCPKIYSPVCGSNCVTYDNECLMVVDGCEKKQDIVIAFPGACDESDHCGVSSGDSRPPGGSGSSEDECGCKYGATCEYTIDDEDAKCICSFACESRHPSPVCDSDGKTYTNECEVKKAQCEQQKAIVITGSGPCKVTCADSKYGCCRNGVTTAKGRDKAGCPEKCQCNQYGSYGTSCDPKTKQCVCRPGVGGLRCDRCKPGFWNFRALTESQTPGCMACRCNVDGSTRDDCDQMTGRCSCKAGVKGKKCTECQSNGSWVTSSVCETTASTSESSSSCEDLNCRSGQVCVRDEDSGSFVCRCPSLSSCNSFIGGNVCGSDGVTYPDECQMRVMSCKHGHNVTVISEGMCQETALPIKETPTVAGSIKPITTTATKTTTTQKLPAPEPEPSYIVSTVTGTSPEPEPQPETFPEPEPEPETSPEPQPRTFTEPKLRTSPEPKPKTVPAKEAQTTAIVRTTVKTPDDIVSSGSGCNFSDDEDCMGSGDEEQEEQSTTFQPTTVITTTTTTTTETTTTPPSENTVIFNGKGLFKNIDGVSLKYNEDLSNPQSELFITYSNLVEGKMMEYASNPLLDHKVKAISINSFTEYTSWFWKSGVNVNFDIHLAPGTLGEEVQRALNSASSNAHKFTISGPTGESTTADVKETTTANRSIEYAEDMEWDVPQFSGASYASFEIADIPVFSSLTLKMTFRSFDSEGLLAYAGQGERETDFVSLAVKQGRVEFRFNTGSGPLILKSKQVVNDSRWHEVTARRNRREGMLEVDRKRAVLGTSPRGTNGLNINSHLYVGGWNSRKKYRISEQVEVKKSLTGCVESLFLQERPILLNSTEENRKNFHRIAECAFSPCFPNPCMNSANCFITKQEERFTNKCQCKPGFEGDSCDSKIDPTRQDPCLENKCHVTATCRALNENEYVCKCPSNRRGNFCDLEIAAEMDSPLFMPAFAGNSYLVRDSMGKAVRDHMEVEIVFYASRPNGLIFFNGQRKPSTKDFVALNLKEQHLEFLYDLGHGMARIRSSQPVALNEWHVITLTRNMRIGQIIVDGRPTERGESPKKHSQLNVNQPLYLGAVPDDLKLPEDCGITVGLTGALQKFEVNERVVDLTLKNSDRAYNVAPFNGHACYRTPCFNGGTCHPRLGDYTCACTEGWSGTRCGIESLDTNIQRAQAVRGFHFDGNTKAMYMNDVKLRSRSPSHNSYELEISTTNRHGLLLMVGKATSTASGSGDYLALAVSNGRVQLRYDLGSGSAHIVSKEKINDGSMIKIKVERHHKVASLQVNNGLVQRVESPGRTRMLNTDEHMWIGGIDYKPRGIGLYKSFFQHFTGCFNSLLIHGVSVDLLDDALNSPQLPPCT